MGRSMARHPHEMMIGGVWRGPLRHIGKGWINMYVLAWALTEDDLASLREACDRTGLPLECPSVEAERGEPLVLREDLLGAFVSSTTPLPEPLSAEDISRTGAYVVTVHHAPTPGDMLTAFHSGSSFAMSEPLGTSRLTSFLTYLRDVAAPQSTQVLDLDPSDVLATPSATVQLSPAEGKALRALSTRRSTIVPRPELMRLAGEDPRDLVQALQKRFREVGSGAQILKVPHMGFRLVGEVRLKSNP